MIHQLKVKSEYFEAITSGKKTFEVRKNDRNFQVGDFLALNEVNEQTNETGRCCLVKVGYILKSHTPDDYIIMSIVPCEIRKIFDTGYNKIPIYDN